MSTYTTKAADIHKAWFIVDAKGQTLGRMASQIAYVLRGKHKPTYTPHMDMGDCVVVINAKDVHLSGDKETSKVYHRHTGYFGGIRTETVSEVREKHPERLIERAVKGMLPKNRLGREIFKSLRVYSDAEHPHNGQNPQPLPPRTAPSPAVAVKK